MTSQDLAKQQKVGNIGQVAGSVGAGLATIALTGNVQLGAKAIGKGFDNLGDVDPNSKGLQTVSNVGQAGSQIASMVGPTGGAAVLPTSLNLSFVVPSRAEVSTFITLCPASKALFDTFRSGL